MVDMGRMPEPKLAEGATLEHAFKAIQIADNNSNICASEFVNELLAVSVAVKAIAAAATMATQSGEYDYMPSQYAAIAVALCSLGMERDEDGDVYWDCDECTEFHISALPPLTCPDQAS